MLDRVTATNFQSWPHLEFQLTNGITLIDGYNEDDQTSEGSGKSSCLNAISWGAYGKLPKDTKIDDIILYGESNAIVTLEFSDGSKIVRSRKPNDLYLQKPSGEQVRGKDARETQQFIEDYLGSSFDTFCQCEYFAQNYENKFLLSNQETKGRILSSIQNLEIFDKARKEVMDLLRVETDKLASIGTEIKLQESMIGNFKEQEALVRNFIQDKIRVYNDQRTAVEQRLTTVSAEILKTLEQVENAKEEISVVTTQLASENEVQLKTTMEMLQTRLAQVNFEMNQVDVIVRNFRAKEKEGKDLASRYELLSNRKVQLSDINNDKSYLLLIQEKSKLLKVEMSDEYAQLVAKHTQLEDYLKLPTKKCPTCGTEVANLDSSHVHRELNSCKESMRRLLEYSAQKLEDVEHKVSSLEQRFVEDRNSIDKEMESILVRLEDISAYLDNNPLPSSRVDESHLRTEMQEVQSKLKAIADQNNALRELNIKLGFLEQQSSKQIAVRDGIIGEQLSLKEPDTQVERTKLEELKVSISNTSSLMNQLNQKSIEVRTYIGQLETLKDGFREIKSYVFNNALTELNFKSNQYLSQLFEVDASIRFINEDQKIGVVIKLDGKETSLGLLSGGQSRRFNLAVDLAISDISSHRTSSKLGFIALDEYHKDLSESSMEKCLNLLKTRKSPVILIEHNSIFKSIVDNVFFVRLKNGRSSHEAVYGT